jgi:hypothetical protein
MNSRLLTACGRQSGDAGRFSMIENNPASVGVLVPLLAEMGYEVREYDHNLRWLIEYSGGRTRKCVLHVTAALLRSRSETRF